MKLRAGIIGLGVGESHIAGYESHPNAEVVALCDFSEEVTLAMMNKYPKIKVTKNADEILKDPKIDVVSIASYDNYHYEQIVKAIKHQKHIFVEKPICLYEKEAEHICELLKQNPNIRISSNLILRMSPRFKSLKKMIEQNNLGELFYVEGDYNYGRIHKITEGWRGKIDFYSVTYGGAIHIVDLLLWLTGVPIVEVFAYGNQIASRGSQFRYHDTAVALLKFQNGIIGKVSSNYACMHPHFHKLSLYGTKATFVNDLKHGILFESRDPTHPPREINEEYPGVRKGDLIYSFIDSLVYGREPEVTEKDVFRAMSVCFSIEKSVQQDKSVAVRYLGGHS